MTTLILGKSDLTTATMELYRNTVLDANGWSIAYATITVYESDGTTLATIYDLDETTQLPNPLTADQYGNYYFKSGNGSYVLSEVNPSSGLVISQKVAFLTLGNVLVDPITCNPSGIEGCILWIDASDYANGSTVTTLVDKSGMGNHLSLVDGNGAQMTTEYDPLNPNAGFGPTKQALQFSSDFYTRSSINGAPSFDSGDYDTSHTTVISVMTAPLGAGAGSVYFLGAPENNTNYYEWLRFSFASSSQHSISFGQRLASNAGVASIEDVTLPYTNRQEPWVYSWCQSRYFDFLRCNKNPVIYLPNSNSPDIGSGPGGFSSFTLGGRWVPGVSNNWQNGYFGHLAEIMVFNRNLSTTEVEAIEDCLINKWFAAFPPSLG